MGWAPLPLPLPRRETKDTASQASSDASSAAAVHNITPLPLMAYLGANTDEDAGQAARDATALRWDVVSW